MCLWTSKKLCKHSTAKDLPKLLLALLRTGLLRWCKSLPYTLGWSRTAISGLLNSCLIVSLSTRLRGKQLSMCSWQLSKHFLWQTKCTVSVLESFLFSSRLFICSSGQILIRIAKIQPTSKTKISGDKCRMKISYNLNLAFGVEFYD